MLRIAPARCLHRTRIPRLSGARPMGDRAERRHVRRLGGDELIEQLSRHRFSMAHRYFFDSNIWLLGLLPLVESNGWRHESARLAVRTARSTGCWVGTDQTVLSEILNA